MAASPRRPQRSLLALGAFLLTVAILLGGWHVVDGASARASRFELTTQSAQSALDEVIALASDDRYPAAELRLLHQSIARVDEANVRALEASFVAAVEADRGADPRHGASAVAGRALALETALLASIRAAAAQASHQDAVANSLRLTVRVATLSLLGLLGAIAALLDGRLRRRERREAEVRLQRERRLAVLVEQSGDAIITLRGDTIGTWNPAAERLLGYPAGEIVGRPFSLLDLEGSRERHAEILARARGGETIVAAASEMRHRNGGRVFVEMTAAPVLDDDGAVAEVSIIVRDASERRARERRLVEVARTDPLTGLGNRAALAAALATASRTARASGVAAVLAYLDLDGFKEVNDLYGHDVGDEVLRVVARRLREVLRPEDLAARPGGDEFVALCSGVGDARGAATLARRIRARLAEPIEIDGLVLSVTASVGVALSRPDEDPAVWLRRADLAMYEAKRAGRDRASLDV